MDYSIIMEAAKHSASSIINYNILGDSRNYMPPILVLFSAKLITMQILLIGKLNEKDFILTVFVCDIIRPRKELPVQS